MNVKKILGIVVLIFFSIHIFEPGRFFLAKDPYHGEGPHHHANEKPDFSQHDHPCCTAKTIDSQTSLSEIFVQYSFSSQPTVFLFSLLFLPIVFRFSPRAPPRFTFS